MEFKFPAHITTNLIGRGVFGTVFKMIGQPYVLKLMDASTREDTYAMLTTQFVITKISPHFVITEKIFNILDPFRFRSMLVGRAAHADIQIHGHVMEELFPIDKWTINRFKQALISIITLSQNGIFHNDCHQHNFLCGNKIEKISYGILFDDKEIKFQLEPDVVIKLCDFGKTSTVPMLISDPKRKNIIKTHGIVPHYDVNGLLLFNYVSDVHHLVQRLPIEITHKLIEMCEETWINISHANEKDIDMYYAQELEIVKYFIIFNEKRVDRANYFPTKEINIQNNLQYCTPLKHKYCITDVIYKIVPNEHGTNEIIFNNAFKPIEFYYKRSKKSSERSSKKRHMSRKTKKRQRSTSSNSSSDKSNIAKLIRRMTSDTY